MVSTHTGVTEVAIKPDGTVGSVKFVSAHPMLRETVETAMKQWSFEPTTRFGQIS